MYSPARMYILLYEKMSIYLCQKMYKQSYLLHAFNIRWDKSEAEFLKSKLQRSRGESFALALKSSRTALSIIITWSTKENVQTTLQKNVHATPYIPAVFNTFAHTPSPNVLHKLSFYNCAQEDFLASRYKSRTSKPRYRCPQTSSASSWPMPSQPRRERRASK